MTDYERATLRLKAFELLEDWGSYGEKQDFQKWTALRRKEEAIKLAEWAETAPPTEQKSP